MISVIVPAYNEEESLTAFHTELMRVLPRLGRIFNVVYVDDGSSDRTRELMQSFVTSDVRFISIAHGGKGVALAAGFGYAKGDIIVMLDADLQDVPSEIPKLTAVLDTGADFVNGWKQNRQDPKIKLISSHLYNWLVRRLTHTPVHDVNCGLKAFRREVIGCFDLSRGGHRLLPVFAQFGGYRVTEVAVIHQPRYAGKSKYGATGLWRAFHGIADLIRIYRNYARDRK